MKMQQGDKVKRAAGGPMLEIVSADNQGRIVAREVDSPQRLHNLHANVVKPTQYIVVMKEAQAQDKQVDAPVAVHAHVPPNPEMQTGAGDDE